MNICIHKNFILLLLVFFAPNSYACKPAKEVYDLNAFLALDRPNIRIFEAKVLKVQGLNHTDGLREQEVSLQVEKNWLGAPNEIVVVRAISGVMKGTSCERTFDVEMKEGERWFVVAEANENLVVKPMLSQRYADSADLSLKQTVIENYLREKKLVETK
jgi:hypothetical protein